MVLARRSRKNHAKPSLRSGADLKVKPMFGGPFGLKIAFLAIFNGVYMNELFLKFNKNMTNNKILALIESVYKNSNYHINYKLTADYKNILNEPNGFVISMDSIDIYLMKEKDNIYKVANILTEYHDSFNDIEYDKILHDFAIVSKGIHKEFSIFFYDKYDKLSKIISSRKTREYFEYIIDSFPNSYHTYDIQKIDIFICRLHQYSRSSVNLEGLRYYLINKKRLDQGYIDYLINRIRIGSDVLLAYTKTKRLVY